MGMDTEGRIQMIVTITDTKGKELFRFDPKNGDQPAAPDSLREALECAIVGIPRQTMTDAQIKYMTDRFLGWKLPENFNPDAGIKFQPIYNEHLNPPSRHVPVGTNLLDAVQAEAMVRYLIAGLPEKGE
jgi:hypothetical protein